MHWVPFIYRVHASYGDYWRFTNDGLKYLFRDYKDLKITPCSGPISVLVRVYYEATAPLKDIGFFLRILSYPFVRLFVVLDDLLPIRVRELFCRGYYVVARK